MINVNAQLSAQARWLVTSRLVYVQCLNSKIGLFIKLFISLNNNFQTISLPIRQYPINKTFRGAEHVCQIWILWYTAFNFEVINVCVWCTFQCRELETRLQEAQSLIEQLGATISSLTIRLEAVTKDSESRVEMLQAQVIVYREDFEAERNDREKAQGQLADLQTQLEILKENMVSNQLAYIWTINH